MEVEPKTLELLLLQIGHQPDQFGLVQSARIDEAFAQPIACARAGHDEVHLAEIGDLAVVDVGDELIGEEVADRRIGAQLLETFLHGAGLRQPFGKPVVHHAFEQQQMVLVLGGPAESAAARRHDVGGRIDATPVPHRAREHLVIRCEAIVLEGDRAERAFQQLPGLDLVEQLEQQDAKEHFARRLRQVVAIDDMPDQILADPIGRAIGVGKLVGREHRIAGPGRVSPRARRKKTAWRSAAKRQ